MNYPYIEAEYEDGYVHREDEQDHSPYVSGMNIFNDILEGRPVKAHGKMVRFSLVTPETTYNIDWTMLPTNARPIRFKNMSHSWINGESQGAVIETIDFGYQYTDDKGQNQQEVVTVNG